MKMIISKKPIHFIVVLIAIILIVVLSINVYKRISVLSLSSFNYEIRPTEEISEILLTNEKIKVLITSGSLRFDLYGNCYLENGLKVDNCDYSKLDLEHSRILLTFLDGNESRVINVAYHFGYYITFIPSGCVDGSCWYISRGAVRYDEKEERYEPLLTNPNSFVVFENCVFDPYLSSSTTCWWPGDIVKAKDSFNEYVDFLDEVGVSENEIIEFSRWFMKEIEANVNDITP